MISYLLGATISYKTGVPTTSADNQARIDAEFSDWRSCGENTEQESMTHEGRSVNAATTCSMENRDTTTARG